MSNPHFANWPPSVPRHLNVPATHLYTNVEQSAGKHPDKPAFVFYDSPLTFARFQDESERLAGYLQQVCGVRKGDRVLLYMQNSPQFALAYYAILRADAVVVPINPMNLVDELRHYVTDTQASTIFVPQDLYSQVAPLLVDGERGAPDAEGLRHAIIVTYSDYLDCETALPVPAFVSEPRKLFDDSGCVAWVDALSASHRPTPITGGPDDMAVMPYTSGTTGLPKGCVHTHRSVMYNTVSRQLWLGIQDHDIVLGVLPFFHVTGMQSGMNGTLYLGATSIVLPRWDREVVLQCIDHYRVTGTQLISTMVVDMLSHPKIEKFDLTSLHHVGGGGAAMPGAIWQKLKSLIGADYIEGYGMSETMAATHINPPQRPMKQCLGIPIFDVDARVVNYQTFEELPPGEVGEIIINGPQLMREYWRAPEANRESFVTLDGKRFLRTGDLAYVDEQGYFFMVDRLKRMINAAGFKVWPVEVESYLYHHPAIQEACVIAAKDPLRGETVKALVVLKTSHVGQVTEQDLITWAHEHMAAYKSPRIVTIVDHLPKSAVGKIQWRQLQEQSDKDAAASSETVKHEEA